MGLWGSPSWPQALLLGRLLFLGSLLALLLPLSGAAPIPLNSPGSSLSAEQEKRAIDLADELMNSIKEILQNTGDGTNNAMKPSVAITSISHTQPSPSPKIDILWKNEKPEEDQHPPPEAVMLATKGIPTGKPDGKNGNGEFIIVDYKETTTAAYKRNEHEVSPSFSMYSGTATPEKPHLTVLLTTKSKSLHQDEDGSISILERAFNSLLKSRHKQTTASHRQEESSINRPSGADFIVSVNTPSQTTNNAEDLLENVVESARQEERELEQELQEQQKTAGPEETTTPPTTVTTSVVALPIKASPSHHPAGNEEETPEQQGKLEAIVNFLHSFVPKLAAQLNNSPQK